MPTWPAIRQPLQRGWRGASPDGVRATKMDAGPEKKRVDSTAVGAPETFQFKLTDAHAALLDEFYLANKALRFDYTHPVWGAVQASFLGPPDWGEEGAWRLATVRLEIFR